MTKTMKTPLIFSLLMVSFASDAQHTTSLKLYQNTDFFDVRYVNSLTDETRDENRISFTRLSFAVSMNGANLSHELELSVPEINRPIHDVQFPLNYEFKVSEYFGGTISTYALRYEIRKRLSAPSKRFGFSGALGINPYLTRAEYEPQVSADYYSSTSLYGFSLNVIPRVTAKLTERLAVELSAPLKAYDLRTNRKKVNNPSIPVRQQVSNDTDHIFFEDSFTVRFGIEFLLSSRG